MPDTGAPWNIPYVEPADLVRDYPAADEAQALAIDAGLTSANSVIRQVLQTVKTDTFSASVGTGVETGDVTGLTVSITPQSNTNKVLVNLSLNVSTNQNLRSVYASLFRGGSLITEAVGDAASARPRATAGGATGDLSQMQVINFLFLDSPASTSALTYSVRLRSGRHDGNTTLVVNQSSSDNNDERGTRTASSITVIEVLA
jgi:hypothetical protein